MITVIIPAHNEERVLGATLRALLLEAHEDEFDVVVAVNGCTDATEEIAQSFAPRVRVVRSVAASKTAALNAAERTCDSGPRIFLDADIVMPTRTARALGASLDSGEPTLSSATPRVLLPGASWLVMQYSAVWYELTKIRGALGGAGVYALNESARAMFDVFPEIVADDLFVHTTFRGIRQVKVSEHVEVRPPRKFLDLMKVRVRVYAGNAEYQKLQEVHGVPGQSGIRAVAVLLTRPRWWPGLAVYVFVTGVAKLAARVRLRRSGPIEWHRDESSRV